MTKLRKENKAAKLNLDTMKRELHNVLKKQGEKVDIGLHKDLVGVMKENNPEVEQYFPNESFRRIFWERHKPEAYVYRSLSCYKIGWVYHSSI